MWIEIDNATKKIRDPEISEEWLEFNDNGKTQVSKEIGEEFVDKYDSINETETTTTKDKSYDEVN